VFRAASGQPYTPQNPGNSQNSGQIEETNLGRKPASFTMDLRSEKTLRRLSPALTAFATINNLFDNRFWNGVVYQDTGSPYYSTTPDLFPYSAQLADPTRYYGPRRIVIGLRWEPHSP
jgi:hypothetical protein